ncbi:hypothetical protein RBB78_06105 [Tunturiibacter empetritectus]|uniref:hypothetical protein n=1 Tax=Tunturiibacter empetritectus TaxID=3069691 RepID=UPI003D9B4DF1
MKLRLREFVAFVSVWTSAAFAQTTLHTTTTLVVVPTLVQTPGKELVYSLKADDFVLADNGVPQKVTLEEETQRPVSLVVLMQTGGDARGQFLSYANLDTMLGSLIGGAPNEVSIVNFDSKAEAASPFTSNVAEWGRRSIIRMWEIMGRRSSMEFRLGWICCRNGLSGIGGQFC